MAKASIRRGKPTRKSPARKRARRPAKKPSVIDRTLNRYPASKSWVRRASGLALLAIAVVLAVFTARLTGVGAKISEELGQAVGRAGFEVKRVEVTGANRLDQAKVYDIALGERNRSMASVDLDGLRASLLEYGWVADARVSRRLPDTLVIDIVERRPSAVWRDEGELALIDREGVVLETVEPGETRGLPVIAGDRANLKAESLDALLDEAPALRPLVTHATWVGNRRWDLKFQSGELLSLPEGEDEQIAALIEFARMDGSSRLLGRGLIRVDMRDPEKLVLLPGERGAPETEPAAADTQEPGEE